MVDDYYCSRCGRRLKHPKLLGDRIYGTYCVTQVISKVPVQTVKENKPW